LWRNGLEQPAGGPVLGERGAGERRDAAARGRAGQQFRQRRAQAPPLPGVGDDEGDLGVIGPWYAVVPGFGHDPAAERRHDHLAVEVAGLRQVRERLIREPRRRRHEPAMQRRRRQRRVEAPEPWLVGWRQATELEQGAVGEQDVSILQLASGPHRLFDPVLRRPTLLHGRSFRVGCVSQPTLPQEGFVSQPTLLGSGHGRRP
jgi:hypothetical protein